jgi:dTDP-4-amino-4,6-dideoxygalactose transaminase
MEQIENAVEAERSKLKGVSQRLKAVIPVHFGGHPCDIDPILEFAERHKLKVMEDAAHAIPTRYKGCLVGAFGDVTCFSFYANKTMTTGEGGMLCTDNDEIAKRVKVMRLHGINWDMWDRFSTGASWEYDVVAPGFKYNMPDINAALGIHQLQKVKLFREKRQRIAEKYYDELKDISGLILPKLKCEMGDHSWYLFMVLIEPEETKNGMDRNRFIEAMTKRNIGTSVHYKPLHRMTYYRERYGLKPEMFPNAEWVFKRCVSLPMFSAMSDEQINYVIQSIKGVLA